MTQLESDKWHFRRGGAVQRPLRWDEFRQLVWTGGLKRTDQVWNKVSAKWVDAAEHPDVRRVLIERKAAQATAPAVSPKPTPTPSTGAPRPLPVAATTPPSRGAVFAVQVTDPSSGQTSTVDVLAATADEARAQVASTGMTAGAVLLKSVGSGTGTPPSPVAAAPPTFGETAGSAVTPKDGGCPQCGSPVLPKGKGLRDDNERTTCALICLPLAGLGCAIGFLLNLNVAYTFFLFPLGGAVLSLPVCVTYYFFTSARDYCPQCRKRVGERRMESVIGLSGE